MTTKDLGLMILEGMERDRHRAESFILHYRERLEEYNTEKELAMLPKGRSENPPGGGHGGIGNPTEMMAIRRAEYDESHDEYYWLKAVDILQRSLGERKNLFLKVRREAEAHRRTSAGRPAWVVYTQMHYMKEIEERFLKKEASISENTVKVWWRGLVDKTVEIYLRVRHA